MKSLRSFEPPVARRIEQWLGEDFDEKTHLEIQKALQTDAAELADAFAGRLDFGTGGMRGIVGVGTNRMNLYTVSWATQGIANFLKEKYGDRVIRVALSCDTRLSSSEFTRQAARVFAGNGIQVLHFEAPYPVPVLSFTCRHHNCQAGVMITASHNPPAYNGYKVYGDDGSQVVYPDDADITRHVALIERPQDVQIAPAGDERIVTAPVETLEGYFAALAALNVDRQLVERAQAVGKELEIVYTPLHGAGSSCTPWALRRWGFERVILVDEQMIQDGHFPTIRAPNPEEPSALSMGIQRLRSAKADLLIANDPDSDRMGSAIHLPGGPRILSGNEAGALMLHHLCRSLQERGQLPKSGAVIKSLVTSDLLKCIARHFGLQTFDVPTGFKNIAALARQWRAQNLPWQFVFGAEESLGYLTGDHARDKDGVLAACLMASCAQRDKLDGKTPLDHLYELYREFGLYQDRHLNIDVAPGKSGMERIASLMRQLQCAPPKELGGLTVGDCRELHLGALSSENRSGSSESGGMIIWRLGRDGKVIARPSGTEPKVKFYLFTCVPPEEVGDVEASIRSGEQKLDQIARELKELIERIL